MATPKSLRAAPANNFEDYTVVRFNAGKSLRFVHSGAWTKQTTLTPLPSGTSPGYTPFITLPFLFPFNGLFIKRIIIHSSGWIGLEDPASGYTTTSQLADNLIQSTYDYDPAYINNTTLTNVLIAPWFTRSGAVAYSSIEEYGIVGMSFDETTKSLIRNGLRPIPHNLDPDGGIRYAESYVENKRCFIIRWTIDVRSTVKHAPNFECVLYENGKIEFNYGKLLINSGYSFAGSNAQLVFSGIFAPGSNNFRDLSNQTRYSRSEYELGGYVYDAGFSDSGRPFVTTLTYADWFGEGTRITFIPPQLRKRDLPRKQLDNNFTDHRSVGAYFDQKTQVFSNRSVEFPSMLPRNTVITSDSDVDLLLNFRGRPSKNTSITATLPVTDRQIDSRLFSNVPLASDSNTFTENNLHELDYQDKPFYSEGSSVDDIGPGFDQELKNKSKLTYNFYVNHKTQLPVTSSTLVYFNKSIGRFEAAAPGDLRSAIIDPFSSPPKPSYDFRGFSPLGTFIASGSVFNQSSGSVSISQKLIGEMVKDTAYTSGIPFNSQNLSYYTNLKYNKNITSHTQYDASDDHVITYDGEQPFLIEKVVIKLPLEYGSGWFNDKTTTRWLSGSAGLDIGGPALTVSLLNEQKILNYIESLLKENSNSTVLNYNFTPPIYDGFDGKNGTVRYRDIIASGSITHTGDLISSASVRLISGPNNEASIDISGFNAFGGKPAVVLPQNTFSGSIIIELDTTTSHGALVAFAVTGSAGFWNSLVARDQISIDPLTTSNSSVNNNIFYVNPSSRSKVGNDITGRSIFGKEIGVNLPAETASPLIKNPWYLESSSDRSYLQSRISGHGSLKSAAFIIKEQVRKSPYLIQKGDRLVLAISKTRPTTYVTSSYFDGKSHDISLSRGDLSISLYGSYITENTATFVDTDHTIGNKPVVDQFELYTNKAFYHTYTDHLMDGGMGKLWDSLTYMANLISFGARYVPGNLRTILPNPHYEKFRVFSKTRGIEYFETFYGQFVSETRLDYQFVNEYLFYSLPTFPSTPSTKVLTRLETLTYLKNYCGLQNFVTHEVDSASEEIDNYYVYDSMPPDINEINKVDTGTSFITGKNPTGDTPNVAEALTVYTDDLPVMLLDCSSRRLAPEAKPFINNNWSKAFPFEERYKDVQRIVAVKFRSKTIGKMGMSATGTIGGSINNDPINLYVTGSSDIASDRIVIATLISSSSTDSRNKEYNQFQGQGWQVYGGSSYFDSNKLLFGFGDVSYRTKDASGVYAGSTNLPKPLPDIAPVYWLYSEFDHIAVIGFEIRGWKYGLSSGVPRTSTYKFRRNSFGQFRDMLEQAHDTKMFNIKKNLPTSAPVQVQFIDSEGNLTSPELTKSLNISYEATSSTPYFDGEFRSRPDDPDVTLTTTIRYP